jgi:hypothetical protein
MANPRRRWADHNLRLADMWWRGPGSETLLRLGTLMGKVPNLHIVETRKPYPTQLRSSRWCSQPRVDGRTWGHLTEIGTGLGLTAAFMARLTRRVACPARTSGLLAWPTSQ